MRKIADEIFEARTRRLEKYAAERGETLRRSISGLTPAELKALEAAGLNLASSTMLTGKYRPTCYFDEHVLKAEGARMVCSNPQCRLSYVFTR